MISSLQHFFELILHIIARHIQYRVKPRNPSMFTGAILDHKQFFVSNTLHEDYVGLEEVDDGVYDLFFCFYHIGRYELRTNKIHDIVSKVPMTRAWADHPTRL